jgi:hypothetical protein
VAVAALIGALIAGPAFPTLIAAAAFATTTVIARREVAVLAFGAVAPLALLARAPIARLAIGARRRRRGFTFRGRFAFGRFGGGGFSGRLMLAFRMVMRSAADDLGNGVFVNQMLLTTRVDDHGKVIKTAHKPCQARAIQQNQLDFSIILADLIQKAVLQIHIVLSHIPSPGSGRRIKALLRYYTATAGMISNHIA